MKKILSFVAIATLFCATAFAQEDGNRDANGNIVRGPYEKNTGFWDNSFLELQGGIDLIGGKHMGMDAIGYGSVTPGVALGVNWGKWFNPVVGMRIGWQGLDTRYKYYNRNTGVKELEKNSFHYPHIDFMVNISNWFSGYKQTRFWDVVPYLHAGWIFTKQQYPIAGEKNPFNCFGMGAGLYNTMRLTDKWHLTLDIRALMSTNKILGERYYNHMYPEVHGDIPGERTYVNNTMWDKAGYVPSAFLGVSYTFGKASWKRVNSTAVDYTTLQPEAADLSKVIAANAKAENAVVNARNQINCAGTTYDNACTLVDDWGKVSPKVYELAGVPAATAAVYADMANNEFCPDFNAMTKAEKKAWDADHKDILPEGWAKMSNDEKNAWVRANAYDPADVAKATRVASENGVITAQNVMKAAAVDCADAVDIAQAHYDNCCKKWCNGQVLPAAFTAVDPATAQKYAEIYNAEGCKDFTTMTKKETRAWVKANKEWLPKEFKKFTAEQKTKWYAGNICNFAAQAKADVDAAKEQLDEALARKAEQDLAIRNMKQLNPVPVAPSIDERPGYFNTGKAYFTKKQKADWMEQIKDLDKTRDYEVTGYSDPKTGTVKRNIQLRKQRGAYVKGLLQKEGFIGNITTVVAEEPGINPINTQDWQNKSAVIR